MNNSRNNECVNCTVRRTFNVADDTPLRVEVVGVCDDRSVVKALGGNATLLAFYDTDVIPRSPTGLAYVTARPLSEYQAALDGCNQLGVLVSSSDQLQYPIIDIFSEEQPQITLAVGA